MLNDSPTLLDTSIAGQPPVVIADDGGLIGSRYRLLRPLGEGGMGNVYLANDLILERQVAVKTIRPELSGNEEVRARIKRECRLHAAIGVHPNIVTLYDTVEESGHMYLVMEYFAGETLATRLALASGTQRLPLYLALDIIRQLLQALACIHDREIVHRDIKTSNILLQKQADGRYLAKLTDFGIARPDAVPDDVTCLTSLDTQGPGTPAYMAPERIDPQTYGAVSGATDLYAAGVILYELLAGRPPFIGTMTEIFTGHLMQAPALDGLPAALPERLVAILQKALAKLPDERFQDASSFLTALAAVDEDTIFLPEHATYHEATVLAADGLPAAAPINAEATMLNPVRGRSVAPIVRMPVLRSRWVWATVAVMGLAVAGAAFLLRPKAAPTSVPATAALDAGSSATIPSAASETTASVSATSPETSEQPKVGAALEAVEQVRQNKNAEPVITSRNEAASSAPRPAPSQPVSRNSEWQVTENHTRKIH